MVLTAHSLLTSKLFLKFRERVKKRNGGARKDSCLSYFFVYHLYSNVEILLVEIMNLSRAININTIDHAKETSRNFVSCF